MTVRMGRKPHKLPKETRNIIGGSLTWLAAAFILWPAPATPKEFIEVVPEISKVMVIHEIEEDIVVEHLCAGRVFEPRNHPDQSKSCQLGLAAAPSHIGMGPNEPALMNLRLLVS